VLILAWFEMIVQNTLAVLGSAADKRSEWRDELIQVKNQAVEGDTRDLVALLDAVIGLLDAEGDPSGLDTNLEGIYDKTWQTIVEPPIITLTKVSQITLV
jgi:hypothetical protein